MRATESIRPGVIRPEGCKLKVIITPADPAISAKPLMRSSVMRRTVDANGGVVNTRLQASGQSRTKRRIMSQKASAPKRKMDRRVRRTRDALGDALVDLMHEKPFSAIRVQHVLDRAKVGRSTFYTHYRDKDDLFLSDVEDFFEGMANLLSRRGEDSNRIAPVREFFAHVAEWKEFHAALVASGKVRDVMELGHGYFARAIEQRLSEVQPLRISFRTAMAHALAGALLSLLSWWIDRGMPASPHEMDDMYHHMVWSGVSAQATQMISTVVSINESRAKIPSERRRIPK
jgi:AcrR family transcriptional regulator